MIDIIYNGAVKAHEAIKRVSKANEETKLKDFATTLMFAICKKYDFGWFIASFWVGDGAMCLFDKEAKTAKLLGTPDEGEFSGQTRFLTMPEIFHDPDIVSKRFRFTVVPDFTALFMMTDGVSDNCLIKTTYAAAEH
ncbi:MAG: protein phosphatase 2C domain-containing protein [Muribaculaceae bacterium]|nr:protein phosphatase 2C domain-containing protein [Muribaculaceae bacterium]